MELTQLKYFIKLSEMLNFTEASKALFITQSTLSLSIKQLEDELGIPLFDRIGKRTYLTEAGKAFAESARRAVSEVDTGAQHLKEMRGIYTGKLRIGVTYSLCSVLNDCILRFVHQYPDAQLSIYYSPSVNLLAEMVANDQLDFALTYRPEKLSSLLDFSELFESPLCAIVQQHHSLAALKTITLDRLQLFPIAFLSQGIHTRVVVERMLQLNEVILKPRIEINDVSLILQMVQTGHWITILAKSVITCHADLIAIPLLAKTVTMCGCLLRVKGKYQSILETQFYSLVKDCFSGL